MNMITHSRNKELHYLRCINRYVYKQCEGGGNYPYEHLEQLILTGISRFLTDGASDHAETTQLDADTMENRARVQKMETQYERLLMLYADGDDTLANMLANLRTDIAEGKSNIANLERARAAARVHRPAQSAYDEALRFIKHAKASSDARAKLSMEIRSVISFVGFYRNGQVVVEIAGGEAFISFSREQPDWAAWVDQITGEVGPVLVLGAGVEDETDPADYITPVIRRIEGVRLKFSRTIPVFTRRKEREYTIIRNELQRQPQPEEHYLPTSAHGEGGKP